MDDFEKNRGINFRVLIPISSKSSINKGIKSKFSLPNGDVRDMLGKSQKYKKEICTIITPFFKLNFIELKKAINFRAWAILNNYMLP